MTDFSDLATDATYYMRPEGAPAEHHNTGAQPGPSNYVLDVHNAAGALTDRFYLYDCRTELLGASDAERVIPFYRSYPGTEVTLTLKRLDLTVPETSETELPGPCQPIGCDNGIHIPGCYYEKIDAEKEETE
jgi:hypothetical protein